MQIGVKNISNKYLSRMFSIKFMGPIIISVIFVPRSFLPVLAWKTTEKTMENFTGSRKCDAKHWALASKKSTGKLIYAWNVGFSGDIFPALAESRWLETMIVETTLTETIFKTKFTETKLSETMPAETMLAKKAIWVNFKYIKSRKATGMDRTLPHCNFENLNPVEMSKNCFNIIWTSLKVV